MLRAAKYVLVVSGRILLEKVHQVMKPLMAVTSSGQVKVFPAARSKSSKALQPHSYFCQEALERDAATKSPNFESRPSGRVGEGMAAIRPATFGRIAAPYLLVSHLGDGFVNPGWERSVLRD